MFVLTAVNTGKKAPDAPPVPEPPAGGRGMTIASLQDLGYGAAVSAAAPYALGQSASTLGATLDLGEREILRRPTHRIDPIGPRRRISD